MGVDVSPVLNNDIIDHFMEVSDDQAIETLQLQNNGLLVGLVVALLLMQNALQKLKPNDCAIIGFGDSGKHTYQRVILNEVC